MERPTPEEIQFETLLCAEDPAYFIDRYCRLKNVSRSEGGQGGAWLPFRLWPAQAQSLDLIRDSKETIILKARQLGFTWLVVGYSLWLMLFRPIASILLFSKRDDEATKLLERLKGMYRRLPPWLWSGGKVMSGNAHGWELANGSEAVAFPTTGGRSYTGSLAVMDEADFMPDLVELLDAVQPTVDAGGQLVLLSTVDKAKPESWFKKLYMKAVAGLNDYKPIFHGWRARPGRTDEWYAGRKRNMQPDSLFQEFPATDKEALAPRSEDKRIRPEWLMQCLEEASPIKVATNFSRPMPAIQGLIVYKEPKTTGGRYVIGADTSEGNPSSDECAATVLDQDTGEEVASLAGIFEPAVFGGHLDRLGRWYHNAKLMVERNNHGHAVLLWLADNSRLVRMTGHDNKLGWLSSTKGKSLLYDTCADCFRDEDTILHSSGTYYQLQSIEGATLRAPEGQRDDRSDGYALALCGMIQARREGRNMGRPGTIDGTKRWR